MRPRGVSDSVTITPTHNSKTQWRSHENRDGSQKYKAQNEYFPRFPVEPDQAQNRKGEEYGKDGNRDVGSKGRFHGNDGRAIKMANGLPSPNQSPCQIDQKNFKSLVLNN